MLYRKYVKRFLDLVLSLLVAPFILIVALVVAPLIWLEDKGSVFYRAPRLGKGGKVFVMYKFRSMCMHAPDIRNQDGSTYNSDGDYRLTKIGKVLRRTSIDELPQFFNVLKGDMSVVGPRPDLPEHIYQYNGSDVEKLGVLPGITGFNQAYYRNTVEWQERLKNDAYYARNVCLLLDARIILQTILTVARRENIFIKSENENPSAH